jgi:hypothetical protein
MSARMATKVAAVGLTLAIGVSLSGCFLLFPLNSPSDEPSESESESELRVRAGDFADLIDDRDSPSDVRFRDDFYRSTFEDATEFTTDTWSDNGGTPETCYDSYSSSYLVSPDEDDSARPFVNIGEFAYDYGPEGLLIISARLFDDEAGALDFLDFARTAGAACASGYELADLVDSSWLVQQVEVVDATELDLPDGVSVLHHIEVPDPQYEIEYRDTVVQYLNAVVGITCEVHTDSPFDLEDCDRLAEVVAERLVDLGR